ncbi:alpha/beta hydrolase family protein [Clostridium luticellarii]|jgi:dipeptidyl aminopeptidase/acylaminoacyl peptidase|uniref:alpha/beta hydrolase family protein n=1 Tax=Clostridium luticellarii TaxID=1691940 RepID=UPI0023546016|nr:alpha/beta fold hydrolase [Clostridium luticellarii]MCI1944348.1 alpha/beta fold hydrolase [Clostridium luticellarii]MCI1967468.1 alpha/beta fold hydrolase [Clostridium luticellarii]MCI1994980.1 alpha/beta fold hydrolase [Clostridium luticellarii]MCI2041019.1 alpha/beta fold hydrolase [Clostridium luticellarii]
MNFKAICEDPQELDENYPAMVQGVYYDSKGSKIMGIMHVAQGLGPHATIILLHGFPGYEQNFDLAHVLLRSGYNVLIFHYRGSWGSQGDYSINHALEDVESSIDFLKSSFARERYRVDSKKIILIGHSLGGFSALMTAANHPEIKLVGCIAGFNFGLYGKKLCNDKFLIEKAMKEWGEAVVFLNGLTVRNFIENIIENRDKWNLLNISEGLKNHSLLMVGGKKDAIAPLEDHYRPLAKVLEEKDIDVREVILDGDHSFSAKRIVLAKEVLSWLHEQKIN